MGNKKVVASGLYGEIGTNLTEVTDLRIGNYVLVKDEVYNIRTLQFNKPLNNVKGILLTDEWCLKFGLNKDKDRNSYYIDIEEGYNKFDLMFLDGCVYLKSRYQGENLTFQGLPHIKYVHQFQNLYYILSNKELEITVSGIWESLGLLDGLHGHVSDDITRLFESKPPQVLKEDDDEEKI